MTYNEVMSGGLYGNSVAIQNCLYNIAASASGLYGNSSAAPSEIISLFVSLSGLYSNGLALNIVKNVYVPTGGIVASSLADVLGTFNIKISSFGLFANGLIGRSVTHNPSNPTGGLYGLGIFLLSYNYTTFGGVGCDGDYIISIDYVANGIALLANGSVKPNGTINEPAFGRIIFGAKCSGAANVNVFQHTLFFASTGNVIQISGSFDVGIKNLKYKASGGIIVSNDENPTLVKFTFIKNFTFLWPIRNIIERNTTFVWAVGQLPIYWYRIIGKSSTTGCNFDPCCQKYIINIHARTISELCNKLSKRNLKFTIESVQKSTVPADSTTLATAISKGLDPSCNPNNPIQVCNVPECANFCVDYDLKQTIKFSFKVGITQNFSYVASGSTYINGTSNASLEKFIPIFVCVASGQINVGGSVDIERDFYDGQGGATISGTAKIQASRMQYIGGVWPDVTPSLFANDSMTNSIKSTDQPWLLTERAKLNDGLFTQTDVSYGKTSQSLILTGFNIPIPDTSDVIGVSLTINRMSVQVGVRDYEIYLIHNGDIVSDNLADASVDWPLLTSSKTYGSNGVNGINAWRQDVSADYYGSFTNDELSDPTFGVYVRVKANSFLAGTLAKIDYVSLNVFYEDSNGSIVRMGGQALAKGYTYHYSGSGSIFVKSLTSFKLGFNYVSSGLSASAGPAIEMNGHSSIAFNEIPTGGIVCGGESDVKPYFEIPTGGIVCGGESDVKPYIEFGSSGVGISGTALIFAGMKYVATGSIDVQGSVFAYVSRHSYIGNGTINLVSNSIVKTDHWRFVSDGSSMFVAGSADTRAGSLGTVVQTMTLGMRILETTATFFNDVELNDGLILTSNIAKCGCNNIPLTMQLTHNLAIDNIFAKFLVRNHFTISRRLNLDYNSSNDSWQTNLHYRGLSAEASSPESWDLTFELQCTDTLGAINIGTTIWKLAIEIYRKNLVTRGTYTSRIVVAVLPDVICGAAGNALNFNITYDTQIDQATIYPNATVYHNSIFDNIGMFKNQAWILNPSLILNVSQINSSNAVQRVDLTSDVLFPPLLPALIITT